MMNAPFLKQNDRAFRSLLNFICVFLKALDIYLAIKKNTEVLKKVSKKYMNSHPHKSIIHT